MPRIRIKVPRCGAILFMCLVNLRSEEYKFRRFSSIKKEWSLRLSVVARLRNLFLLNDIKQMRYFVVTIKESTPLARFSRNQYPITICYAKDTSKN